MHEGTTTVLISPASVCIPIICQWGCLLLSTLFLFSSLLWLFTCLCLSFCLSLSLFSCFASSSVVIPLFFFPFFSASVYYVPYFFLIMALDLSLSIFLSLPLSVFPLRFFFCSPSSLSFLLLSVFLVVFYLFVCVSFPLRILAYTCLYLLVCLFMPFLSF